MTTEPKAAERTSPFMTPDELAEMIGVTRKAIYARIERGTLPGVRRLGRKVLIRRDEFMRGLERSAHPVRNAVSASRPAPTVLAAAPEQAPLSEEDRR